MPWIKPRHLLKNPVNPDADSANPSPQLVNPVKDGDRLGFSDFDKVFDNYDDNSTKVGAPYEVDVHYQHGSYRVHGKCTLCGGVALETTNIGPQMVFCPGCRRQLYRPVDQSGNTDYRQELDGGPPTPEMAFETPGEPYGGKY